MGLCFDTDGDLKIENDGLKTPCKLGGMQGAAAGPHKLSQWARGGFQMVSYAVGEPFLAGTL